MLANRKPLWAKIIERLYENELLIVEEFQESVESAFEAKDFDEVDPPIPEDLDEKEGDYDEEDALRMAELAYSDGFIHGLADSLGEDVSDVEESMRFLESVGLIEWDGRRTENLPVITEKGFDVAHSRKSDQRQRQTNAAVAAFTLALVVTSAVEVLANMGISDDSELILVFIVGGIIGVVAGAGVATQALYELRDRIQQLF